MWIGEVLCHTGTLMDEGHAYYYCQLHKKRAISIESWNHAETKTKPD